MDNCNICSFSLSAIFRVTSDLFQLYLPLKSLLDILRELQIKQIRFSFTTVSRCKLCSTCMYNCLDIYIMRNGYQGICTGSLFFMLYLEYKVGPGRFLIILYQHTVSYFNSSSLYSPAQYFLKTTTTTTTRTSTQAVVLFHPNHKTYFALVVCNHRDGFVCLIFFLCC